LRVTNPVFLFASLPNTLPIGNGYTHFSGKGECSVIDKLELISTKINWRFESMALALGQRAFRYEKWLDLRKLTPGLHAILYFGHQPTGKHKLVLVGVANRG
jgi:hypothetical protein